MILLLKLIILTSIWVLGICIIKQRNMALGWMQEWAEEKIEKGEVWLKPLFACHWCAPSLHSMFGYLFAWGMGFITQYSHALVIMYPLVVAGSSLLVGMIWNLKDLWESKIAYNINAEKLVYFDIKDRKQVYKVKEKSNGHQPKRNS